MGANDCVAVVGHLHHVRVACSGGKMACGRTPLTERTPRTTTGYGFDVLDSKMGLRPIWPTRLQHVRDANDGGGKWSGRQIPGMLWPE